MQRLIQISRYVAHPLAWWAYVRLLVALVCAAYAFLLRLRLGYCYAQYTCGRSLVTKIRPDMDRLQQRCTAAGDASRHLRVSASADLFRLGTY